MPACHRAGSSTWFHGDIGQHLLGVLVGRHDEAIDGAIGRELESNAELPHADAWWTNVLGSHCIPRFDQDVFGLTFGTAPDEDFPGLGASIRTRYVEEVSVHFAVSLSLRVAASYPVHFDAAAARQSPSTRAPKPVSEDGTGETKTSLQFRSAERSGLADTRMEIILAGDRSLKTDGG